MRASDKGIFLCLFFLSGACGLTYEIVWSRLLVFVFGGTTFAVTTVLICFMGGLALGSWLAGRCRPPARPERVYGILEILIGFTALLVPVLMAASTGLYRVLAPAVGDSFLLLTSARVTASAIILLVPTTAMGATLPLLASAFSRRSAGLGGSVAALYGANTLGAFVGCAGAGFWLLPRLGLAGSTLTAALLNLFAGSVALLLSPRAPAELPVASAAVAGNVKSRTKKSRAKKSRAKKSRGEKSKAKKGRVENARELAPALGRRSILLLYGLSGFAAMAYQVAWTRALILSMGSSTYSFSTIVSCYIFGLAIGSLAMTRLVDKVRRPLTVAALLQAAIALSALFVVPFFGELPEIVARATATDGATFSSVLLLEATWVFGLLIVPTLCMGALLPLVCKIYDRSPEEAGRSVGDVYAANTAGTILGAALAGFVLIPLSFVGMERGIQIASGLNLLVGTCFLLARVPPQATPRRTRRYLLAGGAWLIAGLAVLVTEPWSRELMTSGPYLGRQADGSTWDLIFYREGIDATVSVERSDEGHLSLSVNGKADASTLPDDMLTQTLAGVLPMLQRPGAREVCLIGLGSGVTAGAILAFEVEGLDLAALSRAVVAASRLFDDAGGAPLNDPRLELHRADGRNFLAMSDRLYDVIVSEPSNPWISGIANLFTREFFELSKSRLVAGGIHAQWLHGYSMAADNFAAVLHTLEEVFGHVQVWEMALNDYLFLASAEPFEIDVEGLYFNFSQPALQEVLEQVHITHPVQLANHYVGNVEAMGSWLAPARVLSDDLPHLEFSAPRFLLSASEGDIAERLFGFPGAPRLAGDSSGLLEQRFLATAEKTKTRGRRFQEALQARQRRDRRTQVAALLAVLEAAPEDLRTLQMVSGEVSALAASGVPVGPLEERLGRITQDVWPFTRRSPWPMAEALAYAGRKLVDAGGDPRTATAHLLRAWLRTPDDGRVIYDLARACAARGQRERVLYLLGKARQAGFADAESLAAEPLFDAFRDDPAFAGD